jgi:hypothetical protein
MNRKWYKHHIHLLKLPNEWKEDHTGIYFSVKVNILFILQEAELWELMTTFRTPPPKQRCQENGVSASLFISDINGVIKPTYDTRVLMCYLTLAGKSLFDAANEVPGEPLFSHMRRQPCQFCLWWKRKVITINLFHVLKLILNLLKL